MSVVDSHVFYGPRRCRKTVKARVDLCHVSLSIAILPRGVARTFARLFTVSVAIGRGAHRRRLAVEAGDSMGVVVMIVGWRARARARGV